VHQSTKSVVYNLGYARTYYGDYKIEKYRNTEQSDPDLGLATEKNGLKDIILTGNNYINN
jgi:hypothetical protein